MIGSYLLALLVADAFAGDTTIAVDVVGPIAEITLQRRFRNSGPVPVDAELVLPIPAGGAVDSLVVTIGDREIRSRVMQTDQARAAYREAADAGRAATLTEEAADDVLVQHVANVLPGAEVNVEVRLVVPVERHDGAWQLTLPLTLSPRFGGDLDLLHAVPPEADAVPSWVDRAVRPEHRADIDVVVHSTAPIRWIESASHPFHSRIERTEAALWSDDVAMDRDMVVRWATALPSPAAGLLVSDGHGLLTLEAPAPWARTSPVPLDVVLLIDASDSMIGARSAAVPEVVQAVLSRLRPGDLVTVLRFADTVRGLAVREPPEAIEALPAALRTARIGGVSELADGLRLAMAVPAPPERTLAVVAITDGGYGDDERVLKALAERPGAIVHTVAVGAAPNHGLLARIAAETGGLALTVPPGGEVDEALAPLQAGLGGPLLTDLHIDWGAHPVTEVTPAALPPLYADRAVHVSLRGVSCDGGPVAIRGRLAGGSWAVDVAPECVDAPRPLAVLWAKRRLADGLTAAQQVELSVEYQVLGRGTSLVGVDSAVTNPGGVAVAQRDAVALPGDYLLEGGNVIESAYLQRVPAGRTYQSNLEVMPGTRVTAARVVRGGATDNHHTFLLDGVDVTDPVAGTFAPAIGNVRSIEAFGWGRTAAYPGGGSVLAFESDPGTNNLDLDFGVRGLHLRPGGEPMGGAAVDGSASGSLIDDRLWLSVEARTAERRIVSIDHRAALLTAQLTARPSDGHLVSVRGSADPSALGWEGGEARYGGGLGTAGWHWSTDHATLRTVAGALQRRVGPTERYRRSAASTLSAEAGRHAPELGAGVAAWGWRGPVGRLDATAVHAHAQDAWSLTDLLLVSGGLRLDALPSERLVLPGPRLQGRLGDDDRALTLGYGRLFDPDRLLPVALAEAPRVPRTDELVVRLEEQLGSLNVSVTGVGSAEQLPFAPAPELGGTSGPAPTLRRTVGRGEVQLHKPLSRRWFVEAGWRLAFGGDGRDRVTDPAAPWVPGFLEAYRRHQLTLATAWDLPTDPFTLSTGGSIRWGSAIGAPDAPQWWLRPATVASAFLRQRIDVRRGALSLEASVSTAVNDTSATLLPLEALVLVPGAPSVGEQPQLWGELGLRYFF